MERSEGLLSGRSRELHGQSVSSGVAAGLFERARLEAFQQLLQIVLTTVKNLFAARRLSERLLFSHSLFSNYEQTLVLDHEWHGRVRRQHI